MQDFEKLGLFYLGREYDLEARRQLEQPLLYDSRDLVTHAVCVGMTGSGKTGLCLSLIEEAAIDGVPVIAIDPKGDIGNLLLTFPELAPEDFRPWVDEDEARRARGHGGRASPQPRRSAGAKGSPRGARMARASPGCGTPPSSRSYTPGSRAGVPVSILSSFAAPRGAARDDAEALAERAGSTALSVLSLAGVDAAAREPGAHPAVGACSPRRGGPGRTSISHRSSSRCRPRPFRRWASSTSSLSFPRRSGSIWRCG